MPSIQSLHVTSVIGSLDLMTATAFVAERRGAHYLVTNYHVAAGRDPNTGQPTHASGAVPDSLRVDFVHEITPEGVRWRSRYVPVIQGSTDSALWLQHPNHGRTVDVVAIPLPQLRGVLVHPYSLDDPPTELANEVTTDVSIIGFPFGLSVGGRFGIWSRGSIASEPSVDYGDLPRFLIDSRTREGQSGSPVVVTNMGGIATLADGTAAVLGSRLCNLLGIYSGRISRESDLGFVWKRAAIRQVIDGGQLGRAGL